MRHILQGWWMVLGVLMTFTSRCSPGASFALQKLHLPPEICPSSLDNLGLAGVCCYVLISSTKYFFFPSFQFHIDGIVQCTISNTQYFSRPTHAAMALPMDGFAVSGLCVLHALVWSWHFRLLTEAGRIWSEGDREEPKVVLGTEDSVVGGALPQK